jgi:hypothetical protein
MSEKNASIELTQIVQNEWRIKVLELLVEHIVNNNPGINTPDQDRLQAIQKRAAKELAKKYPGAGIEFTPGQSRG